MNEQEFFEAARSIKVNVPRRGSSFGIASMVLGLAAFTVCWIPYFGLVGTPLSALGFLLGIIGILISLTRSGAGMGFAIAGTVVSGMALAIVVRTSELPGIPRNSTYQNAAPRIQNNLTDTNNNTPGAEELYTTDPTTPDKPEIKWTSAEWPVRAKDIQVGIVSLRVGQAALIERVYHRETLSEKPCLEVKLNITNLSKSKKVEYDSWGEYSATNSAMLRDNFQNEYKRMYFSYTAVIKGRTIQASIYPNQSIQDVLTFQPPIAGIEYLDLELPGRNAGSDDAFRLRIPVKMIQGL